ncbi:hypothetical protein OHA21_00590 [Actinoplanes sp. NBC_00393]
MRSPSSLSTSLTQQCGGPIEQIRVGDIAWCSPGVEHWDGAAPPPP